MQIVVAQHLSQRVPELFERTRVSRPSFVPALLETSMGPEVNRIQCSLAMAVRGTRPHSRNNRTMPIIVTGPLMGQTLGPRMGIN